LERFFTKTSSILRGEIVICNQLFNEIVWETGFFGGLKSNTKDPYGKSFEK